MGSFTGCREDWANKANGAVVANTKHNAIALRMESAAAVINLFFLSVNLGLFEFSMEKNFVIEYVSAPVLRQLHQSPRKLIA